MKLKTSYSISATLRGELAEAAQFLGVSQSDLVAMGVATLLMQLAPLRKHPLKRRVIFRKIAENFQKLCDSAGEGL